MNAPMRKGYLARWKRREKPEDHVTDYWFAFSPERAATWETKQEAEKDCTAIFNRFGIDIVSDGDTYLCRNFVVEERSPQEFVVCCDAPFLSVSSTGKSTD
jgi:hypothetical protein